MIGTTNSLPESVFNRNPPTAVVLCLHSLLQVNKGIWLLKPRRSMKRDPVLRAEYASETLHFDNSLPSSLITPV